MFQHSSVGSLCLTLHGFSSRLIEGTLDGGSYQLPLDTQYDTGFEFLHFHR